MDNRNRLSYQQLPMHPVQSSANNQGLNKFKILKIRPLGVSDANSETQYFTIVNTFSNKSLNGSDFLELLNSADLKTFVVDWINCIINVESEGVFLEFGRICQNSLQEQLVFSLTSTNDFIHRKCSYSSFKENFTSDNSTKHTYVFPNFGRDAMLITPKPKKNEYGLDEAYTHLKKFVQKCHVEEAIDLWRTIGQQVQRLIKSGNNVYISTDGRSVPWLHIRLDFQPKYYKSDVCNLDLGRNTRAVKSIR